MSFIFSRALVEEYSPDNCSGTDASAPLNTSPTRKPCLWHDKTTEHSRLSRFGMTCALLTDDRGEELLMSFAEAFRARTSAQPEAGGVSAVIARACGEKWPESSVKYDLDSHSWKTAHCLWEEDLPWPSVTLPKWAMTRNGSVCRHPTLERPISATGYGLWPTPTRRDYRSESCSQEYRAKRNEHSRGKTLAWEVGGLLNPEWVEWLMGWPIGHTGLKPLVTGKYQEWLQQHLPRSAMNKAAR